MTVDLVIIATFTQGRLEAALVNRQIVEAIFIPYGEWAQQLITFSVGRDILEVENGIHCQRFCESSLSAEQFRFSVEQCYVIFRVTPDRAVPLPRNWRARIDGSPGFIVKALAETVQFRALEAV